MKSVSVKFVQQSQRDAMRFAEADADGSHTLTFEEFYSMQPTAVKESHDRDEIAQWFVAADGDGDGTISIEEMFMWTLRRASLNGGEALKAIFQSYDKDGTGYLDADEFQHVADDLGFGIGGDAIFRELDVDGSGLLNYSELLEHIKAVRDPLTSSERDRRIKRY